MRYFEDLYDPNTLTATASEDENTNIQLNLPDDETIYDYQLIVTDIGGQAELYTLAE